MGINLNEKIVGVFVDRIVRNSRTIDTIYQNVVLSVSTNKIDSVPESFGDMYLTAYSNGLLQENGISLKGSVNDLSRIQKFANTISNGNFEISGATIYKNGITTDNTSYGLTTREVYNMIPSIIENSYSGVFDTGRSNELSPRDHDTDYTNIYTPKNTQSIWKLTPRD